MTTLYISDTYGKGDKRGKLAEFLVKTIVNGEELNLSSGNQKITLTHVNDVIRSILLLVSESSLEREYKCISPECVKLRDLVHLIEEVANRNAIVNFGARKDRPIDYIDKDPLCENLIFRLNSYKSLNSGMKELVEDILN